MGGGCEPTITGGASNSRPFFIVVRRLPYEDLESDVLVLGGHNFPQAVLPSMKTLELSTKMCKFPDFLVRSTKKDDSKRRYLHFIF